MTIIITAKPHGSDLTAMSLTWWLDVEFETVHCESSVTVSGTLNGKSAQIYIERAGRFNGRDIYRVFTPLEDLGTAETTTSRPILISAKERVVTVGALTLNLKDKTTYKLIYGKCNAPTDDVGVFPPQIHTKIFDTPVELSYYLQTEVLPWYSAEEGFFYRTEAL